MDSNRSLRLAKALRNATRHTGSLFGNDVRTAYQLLARVLLHESRQQGFELAATRDANFHEVGGWWAGAPSGEPTRVGHTEPRRPAGVRGRPASMLSCERLLYPMSSRQKPTFQM